MRGAVAFSVLLQPLRWRYAVWFTWLPRHEPRTYQCSLIPLRKFSISAFTCSGLSRFVPWWAFLILYLYGKWTNSLVNTDIAFCYSKHGQMHPYRENSCFNLSVLAVATNVCITVHRRKFRRSPPYNIYRSLIMPLGRFLHLSNSKLHCNLDLLHTRIRSGMFYRIALIQAWYSRTHDRFYCLDKIYLLHEVQCRADCTLLSVYLGWYHEWQEPSMSKSSWNSMFTLVLLLDIIIVRKESLRWHSMSRWIYY